MDFKTIFNNMLRRVENGDAVAQIELGKVYLNGFDSPTAQIKPDVHKAVMFFRLAAEQGHPEAQFLLATIFRRKFGLGPLDDIAESNRWLHEAAANDYPPANYGLGGSYHEGHGVKKDKQRGLRLILRAAYQDFPPAQYMAGSMYTAFLPWKGLKFNEVEAQAWMLVAAENGHEQAQKWLTDFPISERTERLSNYRASEIRSKIQLLELLNHMSRDSYLEGRESLVELALAGGEEHAMLGVRCSGEELITGAAYLGVVAEAYSSIDPQKSSDTQQMAEMLEIGGRIHLSVSPLSNNANLDSDVANMKKLKTEDIAKMATSESVSAQEELGRLMPYFLVWANQLLDVGAEGMTRFIEAANEDRSKMAILLADKVGPPDKKIVEHFAEAIRHNPKEVVSLLRDWASR